MEPLSSFAAPDGNRNPRCMCTSESGGRIGPGAVVALPGARIYMVALPQARIYMVALPRAWIYMVLTTTDARPD